MPPSPPLAVVVPILNEEEAIPPLAALLAAAGVERVWVDGGSTDRSREILAGLRERIVESPRGRGIQLATGLAATRAPWLLLLHADATPPVGFVEAIASAIGSGADWGAFRLAYPASAGPLLRGVAAAANLRTRWTRLPFGDQGIFATRPAIESVGGIPSIPLFEDVELARRLRRISPPRLLDRSIVSSDRRFRRRGLLRQLLRDWKCQAGWLSGVSPERLRDWYEAP